MAACQNLWLFLSVVLSSLYHDCLFTSVLLFESVGLWCESGGQSIFLYSLSLSPGLSVHPSLCEYVGFSISRSFDLSISRLASRSVWLSVGLSVCGGLVRVTVCRSICLWICRFVDMWTCRSVGLYVRVSAGLPSLSCWSVSQSARMVVSVLLCAFVFISVDPPNLKPVG